MALIFTNLQINNITKDQLLLPIVIDDPVNNSGYVQQQEALVASKNSFLEEDQQNQVYTDHWIGVIDAYHLEYSLLDKTNLKTNYLASNIVSSGNGSPPHYPGGSWPNFIPMLLNSNIGLPISNTGNDQESDKIDAFEYELDFLLNGFSDGVVDDNTLFSLTNTSFEIPNTVGLINGNTILIDDGSTSLLGTITSIAIGTLPADNLITYSKIGGSDGSTIVGGGLRVRNFHIGFNDSERGHQTINYALDVQSYLEGQIDAGVIDWKLTLSGINTALLSNDDTINGAQIASALININNTVTDITNWETVPVVDIVGKFTDASLPILNNARSSRLSDITNRTLEISTALGTLSQIGDGTVSGSGIYIELWKPLSDRIILAGGTLFQYNKLNEGDKFFDDKITSANSKLSRYQNTFAITKIVSDTIIGQNIFTVESVIDFSIGQSIKIMDNDSIIYDRVINNIVLDDIELDSGLPSSLLISKLARIVRQK